MPSSCCSIQYAGIAQHDISTVLSESVEGEGDEGSGSASGLAYEVGGVKEGKKVIAEGGPERAQQIFDKYAQPGDRTEVSDTIGGGTGIAGELSDGTPIRIRFKPDGSARLQVGDQKYVFPR